MNLNKTLINLKNSKESFFNIKNESVVWFDIYKENLKVYSTYGSLFNLRNTKKINKHFINWDCDYSFNSELIPSVNYNFWIETNGYVIPFHKNFNKFGVNQNLIRVYKFN